MATIAMAVLVGVASVPAEAQTYDPENKWIGRAVRQQLRTKRDTWYEPIPKRRYYYAAPAKQQPRREHSHLESRVHGMTIRRFDITGSTDCYPHVEAYSVEANTEDGAWIDAQRNWENTVRAMVGERWLEVKNARSIEKQCWASSGNQSVAGRVMEKVGQAMQSVTGNEGGVDGRKHRCRILAKPCQAPKEIEPETKGTKQ